MSILDKFTDEAREVSRLGKRADKIMALESEMDALSDDDLRAKTNEFRNRLENGETLDDILNEAFAVTREYHFYILLTTFIIHYLALYFFLSL